MSAAELWRRRAGARSWISRPCTITVLTSIPIEGELSSTHRSEGKVSDSMIISEKRWKRAAGSQDWQTRLHVVSADLSSWRWSIIVSTVSAASIDIG